MLWLMADLDGTVSNCAPRVSFALAKDWTAFHAAHANDEPFEAEAQMLRAWVTAGHRVVYNTGRTIDHAASTLDWLNQWRIPTGPLYMRGLKDRRPTLFAKHDNLTKFLASEYFGKYDQLCFILEDNARLVEHWRELGYCVMQTRPPLY